jgi:cytochrome c oxidase subunit IV
MTDTHPSMRNTYLAVFAALAVLTVATVGVSYIHLPKPQAIALALLIAGAKISLIVAFFMHLKYEKKMIHAMLYTAVFLVLLLLGLVLPDLMR